MKKRHAGRHVTSMSKQALFAKLNASAARTLWALQQAYDAGVNKGFDGDEEDQLIELLRRAKHLKDEVKRITQGNTQVPRLFRRSGV